MKRIERRLETVFVLGGSGLIGTHVVENLALKGYHVVIIDRVPPLTKLPNNVSFIRGNVLNMSFLEQAFSTYQPSKVIHLVGIPHIPTCQRNPHESYLVNVVSVHNTVEAMRKYDTKRIIFASTGAVYGAPRDKPISEEDEVKPLTIYGWHKLQAEMEIKAYSQSYGLDAVILRLFNVYGFNPNHGKDVISIFIRNMIQNNEILVKGPNKYRDFIYIDDVAEVFAQSLNTILPQKCTIINIGTGFKIRIIDIVKELEKLLQVRAKARIVQDPENGTGYYANITRMRELLKIKPIPFSQGLQVYLKRYNLLKEGKLVK